MHKGPRKFGKEKKVKDVADQFLTQPARVNARQIELFGKPLIDDFVDFFNQPNLLSAEWLWTQLEIPEDELMQYFAHVSDVHEVLRGLHSLSLKFLDVLRPKMESLVANVVKRVNGKDKYAIDVFFVQFAIDDLLTGSMLKFGKFFPLKNNLMSQLRMMVVARFFTDVLLNSFEKGDAYKIDWFLDSFRRLKVGGFDKFEKITGVSIYDLVTNFYYTERNIGIVDLKNLRPEGHIDEVPALEEKKELNQVMAAEVLDETLFKRVDLFSVQCGPFLLTVNSDPILAGNFRFGMTLSIDCVYGGKTIFLRQRFFLERSMCDFYSMLGVKTLNDVVGDYWAEEIKMLVFTHSLENLAKKEDEIPDLLIAKQVLETAESVDFVLESDEVEVIDNQVDMEQMVDEGKLLKEESDTQAEKTNEEATVVGEDFENSGENKKAKAVDFRALGVKNLKTRMLYDILCKIMGPPSVGGNSHFCFCNKKGFKYAISLHFSQPVNLRLLKHCLKKWDIMEEFVMELTKTLKKPVGVDG